MLLKTFSALASIVLLVTSATAVPWRLTTGFETSRKFIAQPAKKNNLDAGTGDIPWNCEIPPLDGPITNYGGAVLQGNVKIYNIYYGNWTESQMQILTDFSNNIGGSSYSDILIAYGSTGLLTFAGSINDKYSLGMDLGSDGVSNIVHNTLKSGLLPTDNDAIYLVLTSPDVKEGPDGSESFCNGYCGYHGFNPDDNNITYAFIGNPGSQCIDDCAPCNPTISPNGDIGVDAMVSVIAHELMATVSDPLGGSWTDEDGNENGDMCGWNFGNVNQLASGAFYNIALGGRYYLIQQIWSAKTQTCTMSE